MTYTAATRFDRVNPSGWTKETIYAEAIRRGALRLDALREYLNYIFSQTYIDPMFAAIQSAHETGWWTSHWWEARLNPAGIGITGDPTQNSQSRVFRNGTDAARAHLAHLARYAFGTLPAGFPATPADDPRWDAASHLAGTVNTIGGLTGTWAIDGHEPHDPKDYDDKLIPILNQRPGTPQEDTPMARPYILLVSGHRSYGDGGNPAEKNLTDDLGVAYYNAFSNAGYDVKWWQRDLDGDSDPDDTVGDLNTVALGVGRVLRNRPADPLAVMLDLHYNGAHSPFHVIVPDNVGLSTAYSVGRRAQDTAANNTLDVGLANRIAVEAVAATGLGMFNGRLGVAGVMSERETGVGLDGFRLAMFSATADSQPKAVRLVVEHGGTSDGPARTFAAFANAAVRAVNQVFEVVIEPEPEPEPEEPTLHYPVYLNATIAARLFGGFTLDGTLYEFNENGPVSRLWMNRGRAEGVFPELEEVFLDGGHKYFVFFDGSVIVDPEGAPGPLYVSLPERLIDILDDLLENVA